jgi:hypothetical protein
MERTRSASEDCMESDYRSKSGKIQRNYRSCMERTRSTLEDVWKGKEKLWKMYGKDQKHLRRCMKRKRRTLEDVWKGPEAP